MDSVTKTAEQISASIAPSAGNGKVEDLTQVDLALETLQDIGSYEYTAAEERAVVRKIDLWLMPIMALTFGW